MTREHRKDFAKLLYVNQRLKQQEVADRTGVSLGTINKWVNDGNWERLRHSLLVTRNEQIAVLYRQLENLTTQIEEIHNGIPEGKQADTIVKLTAAIENLETETSIADIVQVLMKFCDFIRQNSLENAKVVTDLCDAFIKYSIA
jgi:transcriptional regulator with XRE-family HTH domain